MAQYESIFEAIVNDDDVGVQYWIDRGVVNRPDWIGSSPLDCAVGKNNVDIVKMILAAGGRSTSMVSVLWLAVDADGDDLTILQLLFDQGYRKFTPQDEPIADASLCDKNNKLRFLLEHFKLDVDHCTIIKGRNGLYHAVHNNNADNVHLLLKHGADPELIVEYNVLDNKELPIIEYAHQFRPQMYNIIRNFGDTLTKRARP